MRVLLEIPGDILDEYASACAHTFSEHDSAQVRPCAHERPNGTAVMGTEKTRHYHDRVFCQGMFDFLAQELYFFRAIELQPGLVDVEGNGRDTQLFEVEREKGR